MICDNCGRPLLPNEVICPRCNEPEQLEYSPKRGNGRRQCPYCAERISPDALKCRFCGEFLDPTLRKTYQLATGPKPGVAAILSLLIPGMGQMYQGKVFGGLLWLLFVGLGYALFVFPGVILHVICIVSAYAEAR